MFCINCLNLDTAVINSRPSKKIASVWRRRRCPQCRKTFTTYEQPSLSDSQIIIRTDTTKDTFNLGRLLLSIAASFSHNAHKAQYESIALAQTVENTLLTRSKDQPLTPLVIAETTYQTLQRFDQLAAMQYGAKHQLISPTGRRQKS